MNLIQSYLKTVSERKYVLLIFILTTICGIGFQLVPYNVNENMLDLKFGFNSLDVEQTFINLGDEGRKYYIYSSLILDTFFPIFYVSLFIGIFINLNISKIFIFIPLSGGLLDLGENIQISLLMSSLATANEYLIFSASAFNQLKWLLIYLTIFLIIIGILKKIFRN
tara:strand:- start:4133 stop:4633 length:501 start_codon:yes stop_codon:yes gene_type:complete